MFLPLENGRPNELPTENLAPMGLGPGPPLALPERNDMDERDKSAFTPIFGD